VVRGHEADKWVTYCLLRRLCDKPLHRYGPLRRLGVLQGKAAPIGPMAAPRDPMDLGGPICPMDPEG
jgi:hypothetical protein